MCRWCEGSVGSLEGFGVERREAARLAGRFWNGSHVDVIAGGLTEALVALRERVIEEPAFAAGPIVVATLAGSGDDVRCFLGAELAGAGITPSGLEALDIPLADYAACWHRAADGAVIDRYGDMLDWMRLHKVARDRQRWLHREEYPLHADFGKPDGLRLMVPVVGAG
jgi:hypothetical protein